MGITATIYSKEEALAMKPSERPMCYRVPSDIYNKCFESIGSASMCWNPPPAKEEFDSTKAESICLDFLFHIANKLEEANITYENWPESWK